MPWMPLAICQHLPAAPSFCAGELCIGSGPVVSDDVLNYPSFTFLKKNKLQVDEYITKYRDFGYIKLTTRPLSPSDCARVNKKSASTTNKKDNARLNYNYSFCHVMPGKRPYLLQISLHGIDGSKSHGLCDQAFTDLWSLDSFSNSLNRYTPTYTKIPLSLRCRKE